MNLNRGISHGDHLHRRGDAAAWGGMPQPGNSITCARVLPVRAQRCPPAVGLVWRTLPNPMSMRDHPRPRHRDPRNTHACATPSRTVGEAAKPRPAPPSTPLSPNCCSTPSPRSRSKSPSRPDRAPNPRRQSRPAAPPPRRPRPPPRRPRPPPLPASMRWFRPRHWPGGRYLAESGGGGAGMPVGNCPGRPRVDRAVRNPRSLNVFEETRDARTDGGQGTQRQRDNAWPLQSQRGQTYGSASWLPRGS